jgi:ribose transport system ATP-binding protein
LQRTGVTPADTEKTLETFSGGNQQKILLARALRTKPKLLVLDDPFQGVDIGSVLSVSQQLKAVASTGVPMIIASGEPAELVDLCDRVLIFRNGFIAAELRGESLNVENVLLESGGKVSSSG